MYFFVTQVVLFINQGEIRFFDAVARNKKRKLDKQIASLRSQ